MAEPCDAGKDACPDMVRIKQEKLVFNKMNMAAVQQGPIELDTSDDDSMIHRLDQEEFWKEVKEELEQSGGSHGHALHSGHGQGSSAFDAVEEAPETHRPKGTIGKFNDKVVGGMKRLATSGISEDDLEKQIAALASSEEVVAYEAARDAAVGNSVEGEAAASAADLREDKFWEDLAASGFKCPARGGKGNPAGSRWQRALELDPNLPNNYAAVGRGHAAQAGFREDWFKQGYKLHSDTKTIRNTQKQEWSKKGQFLAIGRTAWKEGGGPAGWAAAINIPTDCISTSSKWWKKDLRAQNHKFFYFVDGYDDTFKCEQEQQKTWAAETAAKEIVEKAAAGTEAPPATEAG